MSTDIYNILSKLGELESRVVAEEAPAPSKQTPALLKHVKQVEEEQQANEEKLLDKLRSSLSDYLAKAAEKYVDQDLKDKVRMDLDLGKKDRVEIGRAHV